jgi:hypothetical protein
MRPGTSAHDALATVQRRLSAVRADLEGRLLARPPDATSGAAVESSSISVEQVTTALAAVRDAIEIATSTVQLGTSEPASRAVRFDPTLRTAGEIAAEAAVGSDIAVDAIVSDRAGSR